MKRNSLITLIIVCAAVVLACVAGYFYAQNRQIIDKTQQQLQSERASLREQAADLEHKIKELETQLREEAVPAPAPEKLREVFVSDNATAELPEELKAESVQDRAMNFFSYLDSKGYAAQREVQGSSREIVERALQQLEATRPLIGGENQDLFTLMKNITFFYRVLGKNTLLMARDILVKEADLMEPVAALLYEWLDPWSFRESASPVSREMMYDYAGFFLQSMGGRSYLFRRDPGVRMLTLYYSLLTLDQANRAGLNSEGIDIGPPIEALIQEMRYSRRLSDRQKYVTQLREIQERY